MRSRRSSLRDSLTRLAYSAWFNICANPSNATGSRSLLRLSFEWNSKVHEDKGFTYGSLQRDPQRRNFSSTMKGFFLTSNVLCPLYLRIPHLSLFHSTLLSSFSVKLFISFCLKMPIQDTFGEPWIKWISNIVLSIFIEITRNDVGQVFFSSFLFSSIFFSFFFTKTKFYIEKYCISRR